TRAASGRPWRGNDKGSPRTDAPPPARGNPTAGAPSPPRGGRRPPGAASRPRPRGPGPRAPRAPPRGPAPPAPPARRRSRPASCREPVALAAHGLDQRAARGAELLAQLGDVHVDGARLDPLGVCDVPDFPEQPPPREDPPGLAREQRRERGLERGEL